MAWKRRFRFTASFVFETEVKNINAVKDIAKNYTDQCFKACKELEADLFEVNFLDDMEIVEGTSQTVGYPDFKA